MAHVIEKHYEHGHTDDGTSAASLIVLILAIVLIVGFALFAFGAFPFANRGDTDLDVNVRTPDLTPTVETPVTPNPAQ